MNIYYKKSTINLSLLFLLGIGGCGSSHNPDDYKIEGGAAKGITSMEFPENLKKELGDNLQYYLKPDAHYVLLVINNVKLANLSQSEKGFLADNILKETPRYLYGKYKNRWQMFSESGSEIRPTEKFTGFNTISVKRNGDIDSVWIGPIAEKPAFMKINLLGDYSVRKDLYPEFVIN